MSRARLNGIEIDYEVSGSGPPVLLSHGYSATRRMWDDQHRALGVSRVMAGDAQRAELVGTPTGRTCAHCGSSVEQGAIIAVHEGRASAIRTC